MRIVGVAAVVAALVARGGVVRAQSLGDVAASLGTCTAVPIQGLSNQVLDTLQCLHPGYLVAVDGGPQGRVHASGGGDAPVHMVLRPDARDRLYALAASYGDIYVNDTFRSSVDQYLLHIAGDHAGCYGGPAGPGNGRHEMGVAVDVNSGDAIASNTSDAICCRPMPSSDPVHFECRGDCVTGSGGYSGNGDDLAVRRWGVEAFQHLWNINNPGDPLDEDGVAGPLTQSRMSASPAGGFPHGGCAPVVDEDHDGSPQGTDCDDHDPRRAPGLPELCDGIDDDCNGLVDDRVTRACGVAVGVCRRGVETCAAGVWGACAGDVAPTPETCNGLDDDCDGVTDDGDVCAREEAAWSGASEGGSTDVDGDRRADACARTAEGFRCLLASGHGFARTVTGPALGDAEGFGTVSAAAALRMGDVTGDGRADLCAPVGSAFACWRATATGLDAPLPGPTVPAGMTEVFLADVDGDGRDDLCARGAAGLACHRATDAGFVALRILDALGDAQGFGALARHGSIRMGDVTGDGRADACARTAAGVRCWPAVDGGFGEPLEGPRWSDAAGFAILAHGSTLRLADVDGDGRAEVCARTPAGFACHAVTADGPGPAMRGPALADADGWGDATGDGTLRLGDVDGDGALDLCGAARASLRCWVWTGEGFDRELVGPALPASEGWDATRLRSLRLADVTGDGRADVCALGRDGLRCWESDGHGFDHLWPVAVWGDADDASAVLRAASFRVAGGGRRPVAAVPGGCACRVPTRAPGPSTMLALALAGALARVRRRPRSR